MVLDEIESLLEAARAWALADPDPATRAELEQLIEARDAKKVAERMDDPLAFGTAGLRGLVGAGPARMNRAVVIRTSRALADYVRDRVTDWRRLPIIVGYDGRLSSRAFAEEATEVLAGAGLDVRYFAEPTPTPIVAYAAKQLGACGAVVVTASHNPPEYAGYKVYGPNAAQIAPPADGEIAARIAGAGRACDVRRVEGAMAGRAPNASPVPASLVERYLADLELVRRAPLQIGRAPCIVYTPLHGVGGRFAHAALARCGFDRVYDVPEQAEPDGRFPTVPFPNPEEPGVMELAVRRAQEVDADLVLGNDPDADRLAACVPTAAGRWIQLTGDEVGLLLAESLLAGAPRRPVPLVISTVVSSPLLGKIADAYGARHERTLTGFKWIFDAALELERRGGVRFLFGYEEALGYAVPLVRDKDGISAAVLLADLAARAGAEGQSLVERLEQLYLTYGIVITRARSIVRPSPSGVAEIQGALARLRERPPATLGAQPVVGFVDYMVLANARPRWHGAADLLQIELEGGSRVLIRPSGTEPKLKIYVHHAAPPATADGVRLAIAQAERHAESLALQVAEELELG